VRVKCFWKITHDRCGKLCRAPLNHSAHKILSTKPQRHREFFCGANSFGSAIPLAACLPEDQDAQPKKVFCVSVPLWLKFFSWQIQVAALRTRRSLILGGSFVSVRPFCSQSNVRKPRENRGRLRHCNGLQTPTGHCHAHIHEPRAGRRERGHTRSQDIGLIALVRSRHSPRPECLPVAAAFPGRFSVKEKDEASPAACADRDL
jgi:hypothetical protein